MILCHLLLISLTSCQIVLQYINDHIDSESYSSLFTFAHLVDVSYCISKFHHLDYPFGCNIHCESKFPNFTLIHQWSFEDSVTGYLVRTDTDFLNLNDGLNESSLILGLRGTRSIFDTLTDLDVDMIDYNNLWLNLPICQDCKIHRGFYKYYINTLNMIQPYIVHNSKQSTNLYIVGHSLGGAIGLLLGLNCLDLGMKNVTIITFGSPLIGNENFVKWLSKLGINFHRVVHKKDIVTTLPRMEYNIIESDQYHQFKSQIYMNISESEFRPKIEQVLDCHGGCIEDDFPTHCNYLDIHLNYFRKMGLCGMIRS